MIYHIECVNPLKVKEIIVDYPLHTFIFPFLDLYEFDNLEKIVFKLVGDEDGYINILHTGNQKMNHYMPLIEWPEDMTYISFFDSDLNDKSLQYIPLTLNHLNLRKTNVTLERINWLHEQAPEMKILYTDENGERAQIN